jgi:hypothetical protein
MNRFQFIKIAFRIIILFGAGMMFTFVPEYFRDFFGDVPHDCSIDAVCIEYGAHWNAGIDTQFEWGARHYWFFWMALFLFLLSLVYNVIGIIVILAKKPINQL